MSLALSVSPFVRSPCGALEVEVAGRSAQLRPSGALWLAADRTLVVADLHLEKGSAYASRGQLLPPYDTRETLDRLRAEVRATGALTIVFLGDALHDPGAEIRLSPEDAARLKAIARGRNLVWVVGNHDPQAPKTLPGEAADEWTVGGLTLRHEPRPGPAYGEAAGHLHPCARVVAGGRSVRRRCFATDSERLVLPAFGAFTGGLSIRDLAFAGLFSRPPLLGALGRGRVHPVGYGSTVGD